MSKVIDAAVEALSRKVATFDGSAKFVIADEGVIMMDEQGVREGDGEADVTMTASADVFRQILEGDLNPTMAFMSGRLAVEGSIPMAMKVGAALS
ncbi:sterol carrier family protein [Rhodobacter sphaeroides]|jgi:Putative sterol carrier protein|uniref:Sterol carrier protein n=2 Tax=Cereibacter sphaeroides TaxID=1063 RepID=Q3J3Q3_CERS4|nr:SCP2 sterol-binding domain-containing protein [Cereibacter sphaeroides]ABN76194.1 Sterol-binding domain protein [Cereibacter sphaeroides ATCC 17029]ABA78581.1 putative sterol carrier protein [Cereibacter sphaeroides 2.4.1]AMJ46929.1 sterol carrier family protein [Cereibacter sphaeroides]ANS33641.1 sterol carrier family protein [Cereibacter sphaeroides]ATN62685.1 sterol carrier family protein [Cereibacter sphaeroides]